MDLLFGCDIASEKFDCFNEDADSSVWSNDKVSIRSFLKSLPVGAIVCMESTGSYGKLLAEAAVAKGFTVYIVSPAKVKRFRESSPSNGKTDKIDARAIHDYVHTYQKRLHPYTPLPKFEAELQKLSRTRDGLVRKATSIRLQLRSLGDSPKEIERTLKGLKDRIERLNKRLAELLATAEDARVLSSITSVKNVVIAAVLPALRTRQFKNKYSLDSFAGMNLKPNESGHFKGKRRISKEGDKHIRKVLYMAALGGTNTKAWGPYYRSLVNDKKLKKIQAINALARKILHTIYGVYRTQTKFKCGATC